MLVGAFHLILAGISYYTYKDTFTWNSGRWGVIWGGMCVFHVVMAVLFVAGVV